MRIIEVETNQTDAIEILDFERANCLELLVFDSGEYAIGNRFCCMFANYGLPQGYGETIDSALQHYCEVVSNKPLFSNFKKSSLTCMRLDVPQLKHTKLISDKKAFMQCPNCGYPDDFEMKETYKN